MHHDVIAETCEPHEEIWGERSLAHQAVARPFETPTAEEIWGSPRRSADAAIASSESIWEESPEAEPLLPSPSPTYQRPFDLPDAWAAAPRRQRWRKRLGAFGRLSRRTG